MRISLLLLVCSMTTFAFSQVTETSHIIDGSYKALQPERGISGPSKDKEVQLITNNNTKMVAIAACVECMPAVFTYNKEYSSQAKTSIFNNNMGYYVIRYDENSFVIVLLSVQGESLFSFSNFYSKDIRKVNGMTLQKA